MSMQKNQNANILQAETRGQQDDKNANNRQRAICRVPTNHRQAERHIIKAIESGELRIDRQGRIWREKVRKGLKMGGVQLCRIKPKRAEHRVQAGYLQIRNTIDGKRIYACAHRLVWQYFFGDIPDGLCMNHKNGIKDDNRPENLEVVTYSENQKHAFRTGLKP